MVFETQSGNETSVCTQQRYCLYNGCKRAAYQKCGKILTAVSFVLGFLTVLFLAMHREPYAASISFLLFVIKVILVMKYEKINR